MRTMLNDHCRIPRNIRRIIWIQLPQSLLSLDTCAGCGLILWFTLNPSNSVNPLTHNGEGNTERSLSMIGTCNDYP